jgi:hypothetical protein
MIPENRNVFVGHGRRVLYWLKGKWWAWRAVTWRPYGGGVSWWLRDRVGLRLEARDHVSTDTPRGHFWQFRVAFSFR